MEKLFKFPISTKRDYSGNIVNDQYVEKPNAIWEDELKYIDYSRGRSGIFIHMQSEKTGFTYTFSMCSFTKAIPYLKEGKLAGRFTWENMGGYQRCKFLLEVV